MSNPLQNVSKQLKGRAQRAPFHLELGIKRKLSRLNDPDVASADRVFQQIRPKVLMRDQYTCQACGFASVFDQHAPSAFLEVHHIDDDHHHNEMGNLVTLCPFCHMCFTLGRRGDVFAAHPIWLPEISQSTLNLMCHAMFFIMRLDEQVRAGDLTLSKSALSRCAHVCDIYQQIVSVGDARLQSLNTSLTQFDSLECLSGALTGLNDREYSQRHLFLDGMRLMPDITNFKEQIGYWTENVWLKGVKPDGWDALIHQVTDTLNMTVPAA